VLIPVIIERSIEIIIALLGIVKAGYAYVPFEPSLPKARIQKLLKSLSVSCIVTDSLTVHFAESIVCEMETIDNIFCLPGLNHQRSDTSATKIDWCDLNDNEQAESWTPSTRTNEDVAYIIYTSGSTGL